MNERQVRRVQKNRHMTEIMLNIAQNSVFKNLSQRDRIKLAKIIYKAEIVEFYIRERDLNKVNSAFQDMIANALNNLEFLEDDDDDDFPDDFHGPKNN